MIHEEICTYEVCKLAKEKGFNEKCNFYYQKGVISTDGCFNRYNKGVEYICSAPTQSLLQRWLREEKMIDIEITVAIAFDALNGFHRQYDCQIKSPRKGEPIFVGGGLFTYELALEDALKYTLEDLV